MASILERASRFRTLGKKIVCVGRNYKEHAAELGNAVPTEPVIFLKPSSSYISEGEKIKIPGHASELHHEVELAVVIGNPGSQIAEADAMNHVAGYSLALDMTDRKLQTKLKNKGLPWSLAKGFDTSCPVGSFIPKENLPDLNSVRLWLKVNEELKQDGNTKDMIFSIPFLLSYISGFFTLETGDIILTGTPQGVGPVKAGDTIECGLADQLTMKFHVA